VRIWSVSELLSGSDAALRFGLPGRALPALGAGLTLLPCTATERGV